MNLDEAKRASRNGAIAAAISAGMTLIFVVYAIRTNAEGGIYGVFNDPLMFVDVGLIALCAVGMLRKSRAAAVLIFVYFVLSKVYITVATGQVSGLPIALVFLYFYGRAIQGTFTWHRIRKAEDDDYRATPRWVYWTGIPIAVLFFIAFGFGILTMTDAVPSTEVLRGAEVSVEDRALLVSNGVLYEDERIEYLYSYGLFSVVEGGSVLTDRAVIYYSLDEDDTVQVYEMIFSEIDDIERVEEGGAFSDAFYRVSNSETGDWIEFPLSTEADKDQAFIAALQRATVRSLSNKRK